MFARVRWAVVLAVAIFALVSVATYCPADVDNYESSHQWGNWCGWLGAELASFLRDFVGLAIFVPIVYALVCGVRGLMGRKVASKLRTAATMVLLAATVCYGTPMLGLLLDRDPNPPAEGGVLGARLGELSSKHLGPAGSLLLLLGLTAASVVLAGGMVIAPYAQRVLVWALHPAKALGRHMMALVRGWARWQRDAGMLLRRKWDALRTRPIEVKQAPIPQAAPAPRIELRPRPEPKPEPEPRPEPKPEPEPEPSPKPQTKAERTTKPTKQAPKPRQLVLLPEESTEDEGFALPPAELLAEDPIVRSISDEDNVRTRAQVLERTIGEFNIEAKVVAIEKGPVITQYELELAPGIKVNRIIGLSDDIAMAMKAPSVRVVAPIPGKSTVGVEVPNAYRDIVKMRDLLYCCDLSKMILPLLLGRDAAGSPLVAELTAMPHLLIAGATGSGKSVCINSVIMSLVMLHSPERVKLLLIDPKMVELSVYKDITHLISPVVTDMKKAAAVLEWAVGKMDDRYSIIASVGARNISAYNKLGPDGIRKRLAADGDPEEVDLSDVPTFLPYVIIIVDELADLMMVASKEVESSIIRLAQKSRAVGIHLIMATQRPSVDVITGLIKSNLPSRIAFQVASKVDSRTILDRNGAEALLGSGDMLFLPPGASKLVRAQGTYVDDDEVKRVSSYLREHGRPDYSRELVQLKATSTEDPSELDPLYPEAVRIICESQRGSLSLLQRRLEVGYSRAARLIDMMEANGIVGEYKGSQAREVHLTLEEWEQACEQQ